jgi:hypothetical protein
VEPSEVLASVSIQKIAADKKDTNVLWKFIINSDRWTVHHADGDQMNHLDAELAALYHNGQEQAVMAHEDFYTGLALRAPSKDVTAEIQKMGEGGSVKCEVCGKTFGKNMLPKHIRFAHPNTEASSSSQ